MSHSTVSLPASSSRLVRPTWLLGIALAALSSSVAAQQSVHLNPVIAKLEAGETVYGLSTDDLSLSYARQVARAPADFVYVDMEHGPMDFPALRAFLLAMGDKHALLRKGNAQPQVALFARFAPRPEDSEWVVKQSLDLGLYGVLFNSVDTAEQARYVVSTMRYPQLRDSEFPVPVGRRGWSPTNAAWAWGVSLEEYERRADLWPLNPDGDLLAIMMIESAEALTNLDAIASTPGVGALFPGAGGDLSRSLGTPPGSPELEAAFGEILAACERHDVACAISANTGEDVARRVREGWRIIRTTVDGVEAGRALLGE